VDLTKLNKIHEVNEKFAYALVEPGVSFFQLYEYIRERNLKLLVTTPALGWGSVIGNSLDRGWGYTPYGDNCSHICGMEVVLADGTILRTGMGQIEGAKTWQLFKNGYGPGFDGLFNQSNFGIVVKMVCTII
jgi:4-cresol dehydrogenase (hydroxylating)